MAIFTGTEEEKKPSVKEEEPREKYSEVIKGIPLKQTFATGPLDWRTVQKEREDRERREREAAEREAKARAEREAAEKARLEQLEKERVARIEAERKEAERLAEREKAEVIKIFETREGERFIVEEGARFMEGTKRFRERLEETELSTEEIILARGREIAYKKITPAIAPATPLTKAEQRKRAKEAVASLSEIEKELIGFKIEEPKARMIRPAESKLFDISRESAFQAQFTFAEPFAKSTIRPEIEQYKLARGEEAGKVAKESIYGLGEAMLSISVATGVGAGFGAGFRGLRALSRTRFQRKAVRATELGTGITFASVTAFEVGKKVKEKDVPGALETGILAGFAVKGAAIGFGKAKTLEAIEPGVRALKRVRLKEKVTFKEMIQIGLGKRKEVPKTITEALALEKGIGRKPIAEIAGIEPTGEFEPIKVGEVKTKIGERIFTRPRFEFIAPFRVEARAFKKGILTEKEIGGPFFKGTLKTKLKEIKVLGIKKRIPTERKGIEKIESVEYKGEEIVIGRPTVLDKPTRVKGLKGFVKETKAEAIPGKIKPEEVFPTARETGIPEIKTRVGLKVKPRRKVTIFEEGITPRFKALAAVRPSGVTLAKSKTKVTPLTRPKVTPTALIEALPGTGFKAIPGVRAKAEPAKKVEVLAKPLVGAKAKARAIPKIKRITKLQRFKPPPKPVIERIIPPRIPPISFRRKKVPRRSAFTYREIGGRTIIDPTLTPLEALGRVKIKKRKLIKTTKRKKGVGLIGKF